MAGHNKWSQIKHKKAKTDAQKGKVFSKYAREITISVKIHGDDPSHNTRLRLAIQKAKASNMPAENIQRAIQKGSGNDDSSQLEEIIFEAYGSNGVALLIETVTDNRKRTVPNIKSVLNKYGGSLATVGAVNYLFDKKGLFIFEPGSDEELIFSIIDQFEIEEIDINDDQSIEIICKPELFEQVKIGFDERYIEYLHADIEQIPSTKIKLDEAAAKSIFTLIEKLEEDDDVQKTHTNLEVIS